MGKITLEQLREMRNSKQNELDKRNVKDKDCRIVVGMGTCGIASGAKQTLDAFIRVLDEKGLTNVSVTQTGCMGLCYVEPTVLVCVPDMPDIIYGNVDAKVAEEIVEKHILKKELITDHVFDRPSVDIVGGSK